MMMPKIKNSHWVLAFAAVLLSACSTPKQQPQYAQVAKHPAIKSDAMAATCRHQAAWRYNTREQQINVGGFKRYHGSYEIQGSTASLEGFTCSFDENGQFLHLSTS